VWLIDKPRVNDLHPTMKPVELIERAVLNSSRKGELVLDPFAGSGSTLIACEKTGRRSRLIELDPRYVDVTIARWENYTGQQAKLATDGRSFTEVVQARQGPSTGGGSPMEWPPQCPAVGAASLGNHTQGQEKKPS
jgi:DNA methylase